MKILMLCYEFPPLGGGAGQMVYGLSTALAKLGHQIDVVTMGYRGLSDCEHTDGVQVHRLPCIRLKEYVCTVPEAGTYLLSAFLKIRRLISLSRYDINHTHFILPDGILAWLNYRQNNLPYIITAHGTDVPGYNPHRLLFAHRFLAPLWKIITYNASQIISPSKSLKTLLLKQSADMKISLIPYGFELERFNTHSIKQNRILVVTRMLERKGVQYLFKALEGFAENYSVHIVGDGPFLQNLKKLANEIGIKATFWGWLENRSRELKDLYEQSNIFVLTSEAENFPVALMEAMAAGLAIITTKATGCAEVVGDSAILVEPRNPEAIRAALRVLATNSDLRRKLGRAARRRSENNFSWTSVAKRYVELYERYSVRKGHKAP
jgi:glycosyltransferase involved in cell wall biosynthesis